MLKIATKSTPHWSYGELAQELGMSPSQVHYAVNRALSAQLAVKKESGVIPHYRNLEEFLVHGVKYVFVAQRGELTRGIPTIYAGPPLNKLIVSPTSDPPPVWPDPEGHIRGVSFMPLCKYVPHAARADENLYELLVLVDAIRGGQARERKIAVAELQTRLKNKCQEY
jgi:hypothetical protein